MEQRNTHRLLGLLVAIGAGLAGIWMGSAQQAANTTVAAAPSAVDELKHLKLKGLDGQPHEIVKPGHLTVVNFWASWCPPCREEMPAFDRIYSLYKIQNVDFVGIAIDQADNVAEFQKKNPVTYPLVIGNLDTIDLSVRLGNKAKGLPFTVIIGSDGNILSSKSGPMSESALEAAIRNGLPATRPSPLTPPPTPPAAHQNSQP